MTGSDVENSNYKEGLMAKGEEQNEVTFKSSAYQIFCTSYLNVLLLATPIALISYAAGGNDIVTFLFSLIALAPLAERLGFVTEQLALHTNETIGGLLNATFGNATELIVSIAALAKGLNRLVQLSLLGSILSNMLLVLGTAFFVGGLHFETQFYNKVSSQVNSTLLMIATMSILFPTALYSSGETSKLGELGLSRGTSIVLFCLYFFFLYFQVKNNFLFRFFYVYLFV
jgi:Ca2+:H+ antiporter